MEQKAKNRGELIDIARSYLSADNFVICREDIPQMIDDLISKVEILDKPSVSFSEERTEVCPLCKSEEFVFRGEKDYYCIACRETFGQT